MFNSGVNNKGGHFFSSEKLKPTYNVLCLNSNNKAI